MRDFIYNDKRTPLGKDKPSFIAQVAPQIIADLVDRHVFPFAPVPYVVYVTLTDNGYVATKAFIGGWNQWHNTVTEFKDFETTGDFAEIIAPEIEGFKKEYFGRAYKNAISKKENAQEM